MNYEMSNITVGTNIKLEPNQLIYVWNIGANKPLFRNFSRYGALGGVFVTNLAINNKEEVYFPNYSVGKPSKEIMMLTTMQDSSSTYTVKIFDSLTNYLELEDYPVPNYVDGVAVKDGNCVTWHIYKESTSFEDLVKNIIADFDNPYLLITPDLDIILDFRLSVDENQYNNITIKDIGSEEHV